MEQSKYLDELSLEKQQLIRKHGLTLNPQLYWEYRNKKYHPITYFSHKFAKKHSELALIFNMNKLCYAKILYFEKNIHKYDFYKYTFLNGFTPCEAYDLEFLYHKPSKRMIDLRELAQIKNIEVFYSYCELLESFETPTLKVISN